METLALAVQFLIAGCRGPCQHKARLHSSVNIASSLFLVATAILLRPRRVAGLASITDDEKLLDSNGNWHRAQRNQVAFQTSCYYTHEPELPYGCQPNTSAWNADDERQIERNALMAIYILMGGEDWRTQDNWGEGDPCWDAWYGVTCNEHGKVIALKLVDNRVSGYIPAILGDLTHMLFLDLSSTAPDYHGHPNVDSNNVVGPMPSLAKMRRLEEIEVSGNKINSLPLDLRDNAHTLRSLSANHNLLRTLPQGLRDFTALHTLELSHNLIYTSPSDLGYLTNARFVQLQYNRFIGTIPASIVGMRRARVLDLSHNPGLGGELPESIIVEWRNQDYISIMNTSITGYIAALCLDVPFCYKFMYDTHKDLTWATAADVPDIVRLTMQLTDAN